MKKMSSCELTDCRYYADTGCAYFIVEGTTRLFKHLSEKVDINAPCREYAPGESPLLKLQPFSIGRDLM